MFKIIKKYKSYIIYGMIFLLLCMLAYYFPLSGSDYLLSHENIATKLDNFQFGYIGNYLAILMIKNNIIKSIIIGSTLFITSIMIGKTVNKNDKSIPVIFLLLLLFVNSKITTLTIVNLSNFTNYFFPIVLLSIYMYYSKKIINELKYNYKLLIIISALSLILGLFNDYLTIFIVISNAFIIIYKSIREKKLDFKLLIVFSLSIISLLLMFTSNDLIYGTKHILNYNNIKVNIIVNAVRNFFNVIQSNFLTDSYYINIIISLCLIVIVNKTGKSGFVDKLLSYIIIIFNVSIIVLNVFQYKIYGIGHYALAISSIVYLVILIILIIRSINKEQIYNFIYLLLVMILLIGAYSLSATLAKQAIIYLFYIYIIIGLELYNYLKNNYNELFYPSIVGLGLILLITILPLCFIYKGIYYYNLNRDNIIRNAYNEEKETIMIPKDNYSKYVINNYPNSKKSKDNYLLFFGIDLDKVKSKYIEKGGIEYNKEFLGPYKYDNLMIVAHADDELIWGGKELIDNDYVVVCITCGKDIAPVRVEEFKNVMKELNDEYFMLNHTDLENGVKSNWENEYDDILKDIKEIIEYKNWNKIVVHSPFGESGHIHHKMTSEITTSIVKDKSKLYYFGKYYNDTSKYPNDTVKISDKYVKRKDEIFKKYYKSQAHVKFQKYYPYERLWSYNDWHKEFDINN